VADLQFFGIRKMTGCVPKRIDIVMINLWNLFRIILNYKTVFVFVSQKCHARPFDIKFAGDKNYTFNKTKKLYQ
jgi:hypothetical protein